mmetsp:Transcript_12381/g.29105  ORF Transcript_12381/g.29105 Transcript_12381/m.29105 type:complete len:433 (+) Transcript_12381:98-1396(+)
MAVVVAPPAIAPPRGLSGMLDGDMYEPNAVLDTTKFAPGMVLINVYDVGDSELMQRINKVTTASNNILMGGVFHAGVEVYGAEWGYGYCEGHRTGVCAVHPRMNSQHKYRTTIPMGVTNLSEEQVNKVISRLSADWPGYEYDLIHHNCCSFCNAMLEELGLRRLPGWVDRAARAASAIDRTSRKVAQDTEQTVALVRSVTSDLEQKARTLTAEDMQVQATQVLESVKRESSTWFDVAYSESAKLADAAYSESAKLAEAMQPWSEKVAEKAQEGMQQLDASLAKEIDVEHVTRRAQEIGDRAKEQAQAFGTSFLSWGRGLYEAAASSLPVDGGPAASGLASHEETLLKFVQKEDSGSAGPPSRASSGMQSAEACASPAAVNDKPASPTEKALPPPQAPKQPASEPLIDLLDAPLPTVTPKAPVIDLLTGDDNE